MAAGMPGKSGLSSDQVRHGLTVPFSPEREYIEGVPRFHCVPGVLFRVGPGYLAEPERRRLSPRGVEVERDTGSHSRPDQQPLYYATIRLMDEMSQGDPRGLPAWGRLADLDKATSRDTWNTWKQVLSRCAVSIYAVGDGAEEVAEFLGGHRLQFPHGRSVRVMDLSPELDPPPLPEDVLRAEDFLPGEQTVLCMAFSTGIREGDPKVPAMLFCDGILGGLPHSKLFTVVREQHGLAYFSGTIPNTWRGLVIATSGISDDDRRS